jgi:4-hydroxyphenylpyruvate dioxygenase
MSCKPSITTVSLGSAHLHDIRGKLHEVARHQFKAVELFYDDLEALAVRTYAGNILAAAEEVNGICRALGLRVLNLQPFRFYEGLLDRAETTRLLGEVLPVWLDVASILGTDTILVPSNFLGPDPNTGEARTTGDQDVLLDDLRRLADLAAARSPPVRIAYEAIAWGTHVNTWEQAWDLVLRADRPNLGLALDTFNTTAAVFADPTTESGTVGDSTELAYRRFRESMGRLVAELDLKRLFVVQIADGERLAEPLRPGHPFYVAGQPARMSWSRNCRLFLCEERGYLPAIEMLQVLLALGYDGFLSYEIFSRTLLDPAPETPARHAARAALSWTRLMGLLESGDTEKELDKANREMVYRGAIKCVEV